MPAPNACLWVDLPLRKAAPGGEGLCPVLNWIPRVSLNNYVFPPCSRNLKGRENTQFSAHPRRGQEMRFRVHLLERGSAQPGGSAETGMRESSKILITTLQQPERRLGSFQALFLAPSHVFTLVFLPPSAPLLTFMAYCLFLILVSSFTSFLEEGGL